MDRVGAMNSSRYLFYKGGENGQFVLVESNGLLSVGTYRDADPHIMEAVFTTVWSRQFASAYEALQKALDLGGMAFWRQYHFGDKEPDQPMKRTDGWDALNSRYCEHLESGEIQ